MITASVMKGLHWNQLIDLFCRLNVWFLCDESIYLKSIKVSNKENTLIYETCSVNTTDAKIILLFWYINPFLPSVALHIETNHLFCRAKQMPGFHMEQSNLLKWVNPFQANVSFPYLLKTLTHSCSQCTLSLPPWKHQQTLRFSDVFWGVEKACIGNNWVKKTKVFWCFLGG